MDQEARLVHDIYAAALDERPWQDVVDQSVKLFDATGAFMFTVFVPEEQSGCAVFRGLPDDDVVQFLKEAAEVDVWYHTLVRRYRSLPTGFTYRTSDLISEGDLRRTRFFADYLHPSGIGQCLGTVVGDGSSEDSPLTPFSLFRPFGAAPFTKADESRLKRLQSHLTRAMAVRQRLQTAGLGMAALAMERVSVAVVVLSRDRRVLLANPAAEDVFSRSPHTFVRNGFLCASEPVQTAAIAKALEACGSYQFDSKFSLSIRLGGPPGGGVVIRLVPPPAATPKGSRAAAIGFIAVEGRPAHDLQTVMTTLYKLSPAEAALVKALSEGLTPEAFGDQRGVALSTVKTQLQSVFSKTGTRRQSDLMRLAYSIAQ